MKITIKAARVNAGIKLKDAAKALGVDRGTLYCYEKGKRYPQAETINKMLSLYSVDFNDLIFLPKENT